MTPIEIDFQALTYIIIGLFALVGFTRGWLREALTTILLMFLVLMIAKPDLALKIMTIITQVLIVLVKLVVARLANPAKVEELLAAIRNLFDMKNPYGFLLAATVALILFSYLVGKRALGNEKLTPLSRILGGTLGAVNGFVVLSLAREYLLTKLGLRSPGQALSAQGSIKAQAPQSLSVTFENLYSPYQISGVVLALLLALGLVVFIFFIREMSGRRAAGKKR